VYFRWRRLGNAVLPQQQVADALQAEVRCSLLPLASRQTVCSLGPSVSDGSSSCGVAERTGLHTYKQIGLLLRLQV
jgi:hypothetical protein